MQFANDEAASHLSIALKLLEETPELDTDFSRRLRLVDQLASLLLMTGQYAQAQEICNDILGGASDAAAPRRMPILNRLGRAQYMQGRNKAALASYNQALKAAQAHQDRRRMATLFREIGEVQFTSVGLPRAIESYSRALRISKELGDPAGIAASLTMLSNAHCRAGNFDVAVECAERAISIGKELDDKRRIAWAQIMIMQCHQSENLGQEEVIEQYIDETQELMIETGDFRGETWCMVFRADVHESRNELLHSVSLSKAALSRATASGGFRHEMASQLGRLAWRQLLLDQDEAAMVACQQALTASEQNSNEMEHSKALLRLAQIYARPKHLDLGKAEQALQDALVGIEKAGTKHILGLALLVGAEIAMVGGDLMLARSRVDAAEGIFKRHRCAGLLKRHQVLTERLDRASLA